MSNCPAASTRPSGSFLVMAALLLSLLLPLTAVMATPDDDPVSERERILEHRRQEAASKAQLVKGLMAAEAAKTVNQT